MLVRAFSLKELDFRKLMEVYLEGNLEKAREQWPALSEGQGLLMAEGDFFQYLREGFFSVPGSVYCIWEEEGKYASALRLEPYRDGLLLEALETAPDCRRMGYARRLIQAVLMQQGSTKIYSHVGKRNTPSLAVHKKCGFHQILDYAVYIDGSVNTRCCTMLYEG